MFSILNYQLADAGYYINLDSSQERKSFVEQQISKYSIQGLSRFSALQDELRQYSCTKSHRAIFEEALKNNYSSIFIAEDDFEIYNTCEYSNNININIKDFLSEQSSFIQNGDYDVLMFGCNPGKHIIAINPYFGYHTSGTGAWAYIIRPRAMRYILDNYNYYRDYQAIDNILPSLNGLGFKTLTSIPMIIGHRNGIPSTLQPNIGDTHYSTWISGNWDKHLYSSCNLKDKDSMTHSLQNNFDIEKNLTIVITGHCVSNWLLYLRYLLHSLPKELYKCRFLLSYDTCDYGDMFEIHRYFRDIKTDICPSISFVNGGLISSLKNVLNKIQTDYFLFLEHDWVFLQKNNIDYKTLLHVFDKYDFIHAVWFNKDDNTLRGFEIADDANGGVTPYAVENRVSELPLITTCRWSNNPAIFRTSKMKEWFSKYINNEYIDKINQAASNIEETMIPLYRSQIKQLGWDNIKNDWGTYLYGNIGDGPYVGHTDASRRYQGHAKSQPEINGEEYMQKNPLNSLD